MIPPTGGLLLAWSDSGGDWRSVSESEADGEGDEGGEADAYWSGEDIFAREQYSAGPPRGGGGGGFDGGASPAEDWTKPTGGNPRIEELFGWKDHAGIASGINFNR
jgi:hypothetical protein